MSIAERRVAELGSLVPQVDPSEAAALQRSGAVLIDIRDPEELGKGSPPNSERISRGYLELRIEGIVSDPSTTILCLCSIGVRSLFAAETLLRMGYEDVRSVRGGFDRWKVDGLPVETPLVLSDDARERFSRHLLMPEVGEKGQRRLLDSRVLCVGAGGLGSPVALYLAATGVGTIGIIDDDTVARSNLGRQILHTDARVGMPKVASARETLKALWPKLNFRGYPVRLTSGNVDEVFSEGWDVVVDGCDNFSTRYLVNDACLKHGLPNVHGSIFRFEGQATVFWPGYESQPGGRRSPCYRCLYPEPAPPELAPSCADAGVLGVLPGLIGLLEAIECVKIILRIGSPLVGRLITFDALRTSFAEYNIEPDPSCQYCAPGSEVPKYIDCADQCGAEALL